MPDRVVVFIDYQNAYRGARRAFHHPDDPHWMGQFQPLLLAQHLASAKGLDQTLTQVRVYRGLPSASRDRRAYAAARRQFHAWSASPLVHVISRPLKYPHGWRPHSSVNPQEKVSAVALAVDFACMAGEEFDVGILFSTDAGIRAGTGIRRRPDTRTRRGRHLVWPRPAQIGHRQT